LRYFNAAGADPDGEIGESHDQETHLIPLIMHAALGRRPHVEIYGTDYPTPDGTAIRDYIHVTDLAAAHVRALEYLAGGGESRALNLGTGQGYSVREVINAVGKISPRPVPFREGPRREGDPPVLLADASHAGMALGWRPQHSGLEAIIQDAWNWHSTGNRE
jgi:UDP-glucose 4-epimerase